MTVTASIKNSFNNQIIVVSTNDNEKNIDIVGKKKVMDRRLMEANFYFLH